MQENFQHIWLATKCKFGSRGPSIGSYRHKQHLEVFVQYCVYFNALSIHNKHGLVMMHNLLSYFIMCGYNISAHSYM